MKYSTKSFNIPKPSLKYYTKYLWKSHKKLFYKLFFALTIGSFLQYLFPYFTQAIVDVGIKHKDIGIVQLILIGQIMFFIGQISLNVYRNWLLLHIGSNLSMKLLYDYLNNFLRIPISYFESKTVGDIMQRIFDVRRIDFFLTNVSLLSLFSIINIIIYSIIMVQFNFWLFIILIGSSLISLIWMKKGNVKRKTLDDLQFSKNSKNQNLMLQIINGLIDIKLYNAVNYKLDEWENNYTELNKVKLKALLFIQFQQSSITLVTQLRNILITFYSAYLVIGDEISLGAMMAITFINGQLSAPIDQLLNFSRYYEEATLSLYRLNDLNNVMHEGSGVEKKTLTRANNIILNNVCFSYPSSPNKIILSNINCIINERKYTAIVGKSGSGKTTLIKLLLKYYTDYFGSIKVGDDYLQQLNCYNWRARVGVVMSNSYIFQDSIINNIALGHRKIEIERIDEVCRLANLCDFISTLKEKYKSIIGSEVKLSDGQKQRLLIARALYNDPKFLFFDEATNALDSENESIIIKNLKNLVIEDKVLIMVSHRLSSVKWADQIIVLDDGKIVEIGKHNELVSNKKAYYKLFKDQLES